MNIYVSMVSVNGKIYVLMINEKKLTGSSMSGLLSSRFHVPNGFAYYRQVSNIRRTKSQHLKDSHTVLRLSFAESLEARC